MSFLSVSVSSRLLGAVAGCVAVVGFSSTALASEFTAYGQSFRTVTLPGNGAGSFTLFGDALADGRIVAVTGNSVYVESGLKTGVFNALATFDASQSGGSSDPAFVRVSPDGTKIAVGLGSGRPVAVFNVSALGSPGSPTVLTSGISASYFSIPNYQAAWSDNTHLAISSAVFGGGGSAGTVSVLDITSSTAAPTNPTIITGITGSAGGIAIDSTGRLFTANGFANAGSTTGTGAIKAFPASVLSGPGPVDFSSTGILIGDALSGDGLVFDSAGNLFVGGADGADSGYFGVVNSAAIAAAILGSGPFNPADPNQLKKLTPDGTPFGYYGAAYNRFTGEAYATETSLFTGGNTWYATIPAPASGPVLALGFLAARRRR